MDALFFDYDGTLYVNGRISERNIVALSRVRDMGHKIFLNTGRARGFVPSDVVPLFDGLLCGMTYLEYEGKEVFSRMMPIDEVEKLLRAAVSHDISMSAEGVDACYDYKIYHKNLAKSIDDPEEFLAGPAAKRIQKMTFHALSELPEGFPPSELVMTPMVSATYHVPYIEGVPKGFTKATLMQKVGELLSIPRESMIAFGDSENDADMLSFAGKCAVTGHAPASLDVFHPYRTRSEEDGVAEAIEYFYGIKI